MSYAGRRHVENYQGYTAARPQPLRALRGVLREFRQQWLRRIVWGALGIEVIDTLMWLRWR